MIERELFSRLQVVVKEIIVENKCLTVTGDEFYEKFVSQFGFIAKIFISGRKDEIIDTFNRRIISMREELIYLSNLCSQNSENIDKNVNKFISFFLRHQPEPYIDSWNNYLVSNRSKGGRRKTITCNKKKTKKRKRMKYK